MGYNKGLRAATKIKMKLGSQQAVNDKSHLGHTSADLARLLGLTNLGSATKAIRQIRADGWQVVVTKRGSQIFYKFAPPVRKLAE